MVATPGIDQGLDLFVAGQTLGRSHLFSDLMALVAM